MKIHECKYVFKLLKTRILFSFLMRTNWHQKKVRYKGYEFKKESNINTTQTVANYFCIYFPLSIFNFCHYG